MGTTYYTSNDGQRSYVWSAENRLVQIESSASVPLARISDVWSQTSDHRFVCDGWNMIYEVPTVSTRHTLGAEKQNNELGGLTRMALS